MLNPYTAIFTSRGTITLLAYAALPWLVLVAHLGLREPGGWRRPLEAALILALAGEVNAGVIAWALVAPAALLVYEVTVLGRAWRELWASPGARGCCARSHPLGGRFPCCCKAPTERSSCPSPEQPGTIWGTSSLSESIRLLGFWVMYVGVGFGVTEPFLSSTRTYLFDALAIVGTFSSRFAYGGVLLIPALRYAPFLVLLGVGAMLACPSASPTARHSAASSCSPTSEPSRSSSSAPPTRSHRCSRSASPAWGAPLPRLC